MPFKKMPFMPIKLYYLIEPYDFGILSQLNEQQTINDIIVRAYVIESEQNTQTRSAANNNNNINRNISIKFVEIID